jgi:predicted dehydrogenase
VRSRRAARRRSLDEEERVSNAPYARLGLVGCGAIARRHVQSALTLGDTVQFTALYDADRARAEDLKQRFNLSARVLPTWEAVLADPEIDALDLCLPHTLHADLTVAALEAGKHVLTEKPMALSVADCDRMIEAATRAGKLLTVIHNRKFDPSSLALKALLESGDIGEPFLVETHGIEGPNTVGVRNWLARPDEGGIAMAQTVHFAYMVQWLLGPVAEVSCFTSRKGIDWMQGEVSSVIMLRFASDTIGQMTSTFAQETGGQEHRITIYGGKGVVTHVRNTLEMVCPARYGDDTWHKETYDSGDWGEGFRHQIERFGLAVLGRGSVAVPAAEGRAAIAVIEAAYRSAASGQAVRLT